MNCKRCQLLQDRIGPSSAARWRATWASNPDCSGTGHDEMVDTLLSFLSELISSTLSYSMYVRRSWQFQSLCVFLDDSIWRFWPLWMLRFTYICPLTDTVYMPQYSIALPADTTCDVDHNVAAERNKLWAQKCPVTNASWTKALLDLWNNDLRLYLTIPTGLKATLANFVCVFCWGMPRPCDSGVNGWVNNPFMFNPFYEGNPISLHYPLLKCLGRTQAICSTVPDSFERFMPQMRWSSLHGRETPATPSLWM